MGGGQGVVKQGIMRENGKGLGRRTDFVFDNWHLLFFIRFECSFKSSLSSDKSLIQ